MSIYHLTVKIGSKGEGHSAGQKCAYITRTENYTKKADECAYSASGNMPKWPKTNPQKDPSVYWKAADIYERDNGRLYREVEFALPRELSLEQQKNLCHAFAERLATLDKGEKLPFTFAIHTDKENRNPHCHLMISERVNDGIPRNASTWFKRANPKEPKQGGAAKTQELKGKQWLEPTRQLWAQMANVAMKSGIPDFNERTDSIDHRSNKARGLDALPMLHMGRKCEDMMKRDKPCQRGAKVARENQIRRAGNTFCHHQYREPRTRIGRTMFVSFKKVSTKSFGGVREDGKPKTWEDVMRDIDALIKQILKTNQNIAEMEIEFAKIQLERINEQIRVSKEVTDVLGFHDTYSRPVAYTPALKPPAPKPALQVESVAAVVKPAPEPKPKRPNPITLKRKPITPRPSWAVDTSGRG